MGDNIVKLVLQTVAAGSGFAEVTRQTSELHKKLGKLSQGAHILGSALGAVGGMFGRSLAMLLQGGIWGAAAEVVKFVIEKTGMLKGKTEELNRTLEETKRRFDAIKSGYETAVSAIDKEIARRKTVLDLTKNQQKAELELAAAKAKAKGDEAKAVRLAEEIARIEGEAAKKRERLTVEQADRKLAAARKAAGTARYVDEEGNFDAKAWEKQRRLINGSIAGQEQKIKDEYATASRLTRDEKAPVLEKIRDLEKELEMSKQARAKHLELAKAEREIAKNLKEAIEDRKNAIVAENTAGTAARAGVVAAKAAALDEAANKAKARVEGEEKAKARVEGEVGGYRARFAEHFDLWRDPAAAQQAQDAAKKKTLDLRAFYRAVNRYGGKGKIDEAAELMRSGDEEGLQERLAAWRKSSKFNGQTEQMVLAAAAKKNEDESGRALVDIRATSAEIDRKLEAIKEAFVASE